MGESKSKKMGNLFREESNSKEIELNLGLGLSLGGKFGVDKTSNKLIRSCSVAPVLVPVVAVPYRTCSLPVESEEEWRKRKETQYLRRMAAKRRRSEKRSAVLKPPAAAITPHFPLPKHSSSSSSSIQGLIPGNINSAAAAGPSTHSQGTGGQPVLDPNNQATVATAGTQSGGTASIPPSGPETGNTSNSLDAAAAIRRRTEPTSLEDMPSVFTKGDGPNGRRIEGILYQYGTGEDVRIMCVCHGDFHSPAGFVRHAGGTDTNRPLKHIVINSNSLFA